MPRIATVAAPIGQESVGLPMNCRTRAPSCGIMSSSVTITIAIAAPASPPTNV